MRLVVDISAKALAEKRRRGRNMRGHLTGEHKGECMSICGKKTGLHRPPRREAHGL